MEVVPIKDPETISAMRVVLRAGEFGPRNELLFVMGINTGLRVGDLLALAVGDASQDGRARESVSVRERKTGKARKTPLNETVRGLLESYLAGRGPAGAGEPLFPSRKGGKAISRQQAHAILSGAGKTLKLANVGTHSLRKTFGYHVFKNGGGNLALAQKLLNHGSSGDTLRYIGIDREEMDGAFLGLNLG
jgi:integrase